MFVVLLECGGVRGGGERALRQRRPGRVTRFTMTLASLCSLVLDNFQRKTDTWYDLVGETHENVRSDKMSAVLLSLPRPIYKYYMVWLSSKLNSFPLCL